MKKVISILLVLVMLCSVLSVFFIAFAANGFTYELKGNNAVITEWTNTSGSLTIPATIDNHPVTEIGAYAFADKPSISYVTFNGNNLTTIGEGAFSTNNTCASLSIPASVITIGPRAFHSWVKLSSLTFADGSNITTIDKWAFRNAQSLSKITFPDKENGTITIEQGAFSYCSALISVVLPKCVNFIGEEAFIGCIHLQRVTIKNRTASIGENAFDLTYSEGSTRALEIKGYEGSTAQVFAEGNGSTVAGEGFTFTALTEVNAEDDTIIIPPDAGTYDVRVTVTHNGSVGDFGTTALGGKQNDSCGVIVRYKTNNGTGDENNYNIARFNAKTSSTSPRTKQTINGFPDLVYLYFDEDGWSAKFAHLTKLEVKGTSQNSWTTLWEGDLQVGTAFNPYAISVDSSGTIKNDWFGADKNCKSNSSSGGWEDKFPTASSISKATDGVSEVELNTDGTDYKAPRAFTYGEVKDQYGEVMHKNPEFSVVDSSGNAVTGVSINEYRKLIFTSEANRASDYYVYLKQSADDISDSSNDRLSVKVKTFKYNVTFSYFEGTKSESVSQEVTWGNRPSNPGVVPVRYDSVGHELFREWSTEYYSPITSGPQDVTIEAYYNNYGTHDFDERDVYTEATCTEDQQMKETCMDCGYVNITPGSIKALGHLGDTVAHEIAPLNGTPAITYFQCTRCNTCWGAVNDNGTFVKDTANEQKPVEGELNLAAVRENTAPENVAAPAPAFNLFVDDSIGYDYSIRGAALKIAAPNAYDNYLTRQSLRFTASMLVPAGVDYRCNPEGTNCITDFGFVYSQSELMEYDPSNLYIGAPYAYAMSVAQNNLKNEGVGNYDGSNWTGVSAHDAGDDTALTFNLVVKIKAYNWTKNYCAKAYITYNYNGKSYTVYDSDWSSRNVVDIASQVVVNNDETTRVKNYCQNKILNNYEAALAEYEAIKNS